MREQGIIPYARELNAPRHSEKLAELVGILLGDGCISQYQTRISLNTTADKEYIVYVKRLMTELFPTFPITLIKKKTENCTDVAVSSIRIAEFFKKMGIVSGKPTIPNWIYGNQKYINACIRGLMDTEGSIGFKVYEGVHTNNVYRQLTFTSRNLVLLRFVIDEMTKQKLPCTQTQKKNVYLSNDSAIEKYRSRIGFSNPKLDEKSQIKSYNSYIQWRGAGNGYPDGLENRCSQGLVGSNPTLSAHHNIG